MNSVSPRVRLTTIAPHVPLRVRLPSNDPRSLVSAVASRGVVNRNAGITGVRAGRLLRDVVARGGVRDDDRAACAGSSEAPIEIAVQAIDVHANAVNIIERPVTNGISDRSLKQISEVGEGYTSDL